MGARVVKHAPLSSIRKFTMNQITDPAIQHDFGHGFNYANWSAGTQVSLVNVPWNNDYRDIVEFESKDALDLYINNRETGSGIRIKDAMQLRMGMPVRLDIPFNRAMQYNYIRVTNSIQPISGDVKKSYYYFITGVNYIAPNTTEFIIQLDVWQSFGYDTSFGQCYIERGHVGIANQNAFNNYGRDYLSIPEGFDLGSEYVNIAKRTYTVIPRSLIMIISSTDLTADPYESDGRTPKITAAKGDILQGMPLGANYYMVNPEAIKGIMNQFSDTPWVSQGILSITMIPDPELFNIPRFIDGALGGFNVYKIHPEARGGSYEPKFTNWRNSAVIRNKIPSRYRNLMKLYTYPYMAIQIGMNAGTPVILKPESWNNADAFINTKMSLLPPNQRIVAYPKNYNNNTDNSENTVTDPSGFVNYLDDGGDYLDVATVMANFPSFPIVNNMSSAYLSSNFHSIAFQHQSADWSQQKALGSSQLSYDQAGKNMLAGVESNRINRSADAASTGIGNDMAWINAGVSGGAGVIGGLGAGPVGVGANAGAAIGGLASAGLNVAASQAQLQVRNQAAAGQMSNTIQNQAYMRDTNKSLADWAARGDYANSIAGIEAKVQDSQMTQPTVAGQVGGDAFNIIHLAATFNIAWKMGSPAQIAAIGEYWLRYGYAVQRRYKPVTLKVMTKFSYWKMTETYLIGATMPEYIKQSIRGIFEKGVTVWSNPDDIGVIDWADNQPVEGIVL